MFVRITNLTNDIVVLDSDTGLLLDSEVRILELTTAQFEDIAPELLELEFNGVIEYETLFIGDPRNDFPNREFVLNLVSGAASGGVFIFRPLDPTPGGLVFTDWSDMLDLVALGGGGIILVDASFSGGSVAIEAGAYDLDAVQLVGVGGTRPTVTIPAFVSISPPTLYAENIDFVLGSGSDLIVVPSGADGVLHLRNSNVSSTGAGHFFSVSAGATSANILLENGSFVTSTGAVLEVAVGEIVEITALQSTIENDVLVGAGDIDILSDAGTSVDLTQTSHSGTLSVLLQDLGSAVFFDDTNILPALSDHTPPDRGTIQLAVDWFKEDRYKDVVFTRDSKDVILSFQRGTDPVVTITRDSKDRAIQLSDGVVQTDINRDPKGVVQSVTYTVL